MSAVALAPPLFFFSYCLRIVVVLPQSACCFVRPVGFVWGAPPSSLRVSWDLAAALEELAEVVTLFLLVTTCTLPSRDKKDLIANVLQL